MPRQVSASAPAPSPSSEDAVTNERGVLGSATIKSGIKRASTACQSCKQIKRKCDQKQPCSNCVKATQDCIYDQAQDGRRRAARKRNVEELEHKRDALDTILDALRDSNDDNVQELLRLIRSHAPLDEINQFAATCIGDICEDQLATLAVTLDVTQPRRSVLSINALIDTPPIKVPARPWTSVTDDDELVSHLISIYFTWVHPVHPALVKDMFVAHMAAGDLQSQYCSPILVNSICAMACQISDHTEALTVPGDYTSRGRSFLEEAMGLWTEAAARPCLTTLQAGQPLALALIAIGKDRISTSYIDQMNDIALDLLCAAQREDLEHLAPYAYKSLSLAMWALHGLTVDHAIAFMRSRDCLAPAIERPTAIDDCFQSESVWYPYPETEPEMPAKLGEYAVYQYELDSLGADISRFLFGAQGRDDFGRQGLINLEVRLRTITFAMPQADSAEIFEPNLMNLNLNCYWLLITLFNFFKSEGSPILGPTEHESCISYARDQCIHAARRIAALCRLYLRHYGTRNLALAMAQTTITAAYMLVEYLEDIEAQELFHEMCLIVTAAARKLFLMRGHARMLFITAERKHQTIPERTRQVLEPIALSSWRPDSHKFFETSRFPNYALARGGDPRTVTMGDLLSQWKDFRLESSLSDTTPAIELDRARKRFTRGTDSTDAEYDAIYDGPKLPRR